MSNLNETILNLKAALVGVKSGGSSVTLKNSQGFWRPANETLTDALEKLERLESFVQGIRNINDASFGDSSPIARSIAYELDQLEDKGEK